MKYKISVVIPTYNAEDYLLDAVESIKNQTLGFENIELILVDDNSNDNTKTILKELSQKYENINSIFLTENSGTASKPRNVGIENATADYVMFLDNDDIHYPQMCEVMYDTIDSNNVDVVSCRYNIDDENSSKSPYSFTDDFNPKKFKDFKGKYDAEKGIIYLNNVDEFPEIMTLGHPTMIWTKIFRKSSILENKIEFPVGDLYEDVYFCSKFYLTAKGIIILNNFWGYGYQLRTEGENKSTCQVFTDNLVKKQLKGFLKIMDFLENENDKYETLKSELIVDMTKIYIYSKLEKDFENEFLNTMKPFYKDYKLTSKLNTAKLPLNMIINVFVKLFGLNNSIAKLISRLYSKIRN